ncbi:unnamed protein product [Lampetra planeri]
MPRRAFSSRRVPVSPRLSQSPAQSGRARLLHAARRGSGRIRAADHGAQRETRGEGGAEKSVVERGGAEKSGVERGGVWWSGVERAAREEGGVGSAPCPAAAFVSLAAVDEVECAVATERSAAHPAPPSLARSLAPRPQRDPAVLPDLKRR